MKQDVTIENYYKGMEVVRGRHWQWDKQDGFAGNIGTTKDDSYKDSGGYYWVHVRWENGGENLYRIGPEQFDLSIPGEEIHELW